MFIVGNLFGAIAEIIDAILGIYTWMIIISALLSWVNPDPYNPIVRFLYKVTEPVLAPIRSRIGILGGFDVSPVIALLAITFLKRFLVGTLIGLGQRMN
ncbi:MAG: YggT family protein [Nitrospirae bacterium]|nr:YggT family protein [Nitrospirota bacterium]MBF0540658.1 YggT family protein [Nitrospirota bacterium]